MADGSENPRQNQLPNKNSSRAIQLEGGEKKKKLFEQPLGNEYPAEQKKEIFDSVVGKRKEKKNRRRRKQSRVGKKILLFRRSEVSSKAEENDLTGTLRRLIVTCPKEGCRRQSKKKNKRRSTMVAGSRTQRSMPQGPKHRSVFDKRERTAPQIESGRKIQHGPGRKGRGI